MWSSVRCDFFEIVLYIIMSNSANRAQWLTHSANSLGLVVFHVSAVSILSRCLGENLTRSQRGIRLGPSAFGLKRLTSEKRLFSEARRVESCHGSNGHARRSVTS